jgi:hypothetical protein
MRSTSSDAEGKGALLMGPGGLLGSVEITRFSMGGGRGGGGCAPDVSAYPTKYNYYNLYNNCARLTFGLARRREMWRGRVTLSCAIDPENCSK